MGSSFLPHLSLILSFISEQISNENEKIRSLVLRILKIFIKNFGSEKLSLLLEPINEGLLSSNWRKRNSAIILLSDVFNIMEEL